MGPLQVTKTRQKVKSLEIVSNSPEQTKRVGIRLGKLAKPEDIILLIGTLGAGKTCLTQGIARGLGINEYTASPSFVLVREYQGKPPLYHIDLYRLDRIEEVAQLGLDDYLYGKGVCVVEWADKGLSVLPEEHLLIEMQIVSATKRKLSFVPLGKRYVQMLSKLKTSPGATGSN
jgi:tRNA threonylcarbamoyladenosine biosynthesis protein TsaE